LKLKEKSENDLRERTKYTL